MGCPPARCRPGRSEGPVRSASADVTGHLPARTQPPAREWTPRRRGSSGQTGRYLVAFPSPYALSSRRLWGITLEFPVQPPGSPGSFPDSGGGSAPRATPPRTSTAHSAQTRLSDTPNDAPLASNFKRSRPHSAFRAAIRAPPALVGVARVLKTPRSEGIFYDRGDSPEIDLPRIRNRFQDSRRDRFAFTEVRGGCRLTGRYALVPRSLEHRPVLLLLKGICVVADHRQAAQAQGPSRTSGEGVPETVLNGLGAARTAPSGICPVADSRTAQPWPTDLPSGGQAPAANGLAQRDGCSATGPSMVTEYTITSRAGAPPRLPPSVCSPMMDWATARPTTYRTLRPHSHADQPPHTSRRFSRQSRRVRRGLGLSLGVSGC